MLPHATRIWVKMAPWIIWLAQYLHGSDIFISEPQDYFIALFSFCLGLGGGLLPSYIMSFYRRDTSYLARYCGGLSLARAHDWNFSHHCRMWENALENLLWIGHSATVKLAQVICQCSQSCWTLNSEYHAKTLWSRMVWVFQGFENLPIHVREGKKCAFR